MKAYSKKVITLLLVFAMAFGSVLTANASTTSSKVTLIKRANAVEGKTQAFSNGTANFTLTVKRQSDEFNIYQLTDTTWTTATVNGETVHNAEVKWNAKVLAWLAANNYPGTEIKWANYTVGGVKIYETPRALGDYEFPVNSTTKIRQTTPTKEGETAVIELLRAIKADSQLMTDLGTNGYLVGYKTSTGSCSTASSATTPKKVGVSVNNGITTTTTKAWLVKASVYNAGKQTTDSDYVEPTSFIETLKAESESKQHVDESDYEYEAYCYVTGDTQQEGWIPYYQTGIPNNFGGKVDHSEPATIESVTEQQMIVTLSTPNSTIVSYTVSGADYGLFFVDALSGTTKYQPILVDIMPEQVGPNGNWYINNSIVANMKYEDISVYKTINDPNVNDTDTNFKRDILRAGDFASFFIKSDIPVYPKAQDGSYVYDTFTGFDEMAEGFSLISSSATLTYYDSTGTKSHRAFLQKIDLTSKPGAKTIYDSTDVATATYEATFLENAYTYSFEGKTVFYAVAVGTAGSNTYAVYAPVNGKLEKVSNGIDLSVTSNLTNAIAGAKAKGVSTTATAANIVKSEDTKAVIGIVFNYTNLMSKEFTNDLADDPTSDTFTQPASFSVSYDTTLNDNAKVGSEENTNVVTIRYNKDSAGNIGEISDQVKAYTYETDVVKTDGRKAVTDKDYYLSGALFDIYKLDTVYCPADITNYKTEANVPSVGTDTVTDDFAWYSDVAGNTSAAAALTNFVATNSDVYKAVKYGILQPLLDAGTVPTATNLTEVATKAAKIKTDIETAGSFATADKFKNKYAVASLTGTVVKRLYPLVKETDGTLNFNTRLVPIYVGVGECTKHATEAHWHIEAYVSVATDVPSATINYSATALNGVFDTTTGVKKADDDLSEDQKTAYANLVAEGEKGTDVVGFGEGTFLLYETKAPQGYNLAQEALRYEFKAYDATAESLKGFFDDEYDAAVVALGASADATADQIAAATAMTSNHNHGDGVYKITVKNFTGIKLPSTGGIGTLLFTLIGIAIMGGAIIIILAKRRNQETIGF